MKFIVTTTLLLLLSVVHFGKSNFSFIFLHSKLDKVCP